MASAFKKYNLDVMLLGSYFNPVHSYKNKVNIFIDDLVSIIKMLKKNIKTHSS